MRDKRYDEIFLFFEEKGHKYTDSVGNSYKSVTTLLGDYAPEFDTKYWAHKKAKERGVSDKTILKEWQAITEEACSRGTATHNGIEDAIKDVSMFNSAIKYLKNAESDRVISVADIPNMTVKPLDIEQFKIATNNKYDEIYRVFQFYIDRGYTIYSEIGVYLIDFLVSGTIDVLCIRDNDFVILDWKTNRNGLQFTSGYFKKDKTMKPVQLTNEWVEKKEFMKPPLSHMPECNGSHYTMQLSLYALMVEMILGIPCVGMGLCHIGSPFFKNAYGMPYRAPDNTYPIDPDGVETVKWHKIIYHRDEAKAVLNDRWIKLKTEKTNTKQLTLF